MDLALPQNASVETIPIQRLTVDIASPYAEVIQRFRYVVPPIKVNLLREQTSADSIAQVIQDTGSKSGFVLFAEFDHGRWIRHFPPFSTLGSTLHEQKHRRDGNEGAQGAHRFIFGNPLFAINMIRESLESYCMFRWTVASLNGLMDRHGSSCC